jgi:chemosensory pili system protein ChpA (sensor histidine kinase/response regulator)
MQSVQSAGEVENNSVCLRFSDLFGVTGEQSNQSCGRIVLACRAPDGSGHTSARVTLLVDEIVGPEEVVVRPLPTLLRHHPFCSGATLSGMGQTVLFLDARRVVESQSHHLHPSDRAQQSKSSSVTAGSSQAARPRVLVVDDSLSARKRVVRSLQRYGVDIVEACDGKEALKILKTEPLAAVFSDMEMPHVSGMDLLAEVNSLDRSDPLPVVIISSRGEDEFTSRAQELGAAGYLIKPLADDALDAALAAVPTLRKLTINAPLIQQTNGEIR